MFWKKKKRIESEEYKELKQKIDILEIDITLLTDRVQKAIKRRVIKPKEDDKDEENKNPQILPM